MKLQMLCKVLIFIGFVLFFFVCGDSSASESWVLSELRRGVSDPGGILSGWGGSDLHCSWPGVTCDSGSRVVALRIAGGEDYGELSCSLGRRVRASGVGKLRGQISPVVGGLGRLRVLSLPLNELFGEIPGEIWGLENLEVLDLEGNSLTGNLPVWFSGLRKLRVLNLGFNKLSGEIPVGLSELRLLKVVNLAGNSFSGRIPGSLGNCPRLRTLRLFSNKLSGVVPREFGRLRRLEVFDVSGNRLSGPIPDELSGCVRLSVFVLSNGDSDSENHFEGSIPEAITALPSLKIVWVPSAGLEGKVPSNWGSCESLEMVNLARNSFDGEMSGVFERCRKLDYLDLSGNKLTGKLDEKLAVPCMTVFNVSGNLLSGPVPRFKDVICSRMTLGSDLVQVYKSFFGCKTRSESNLPVICNSFVVMHDFSDNGFSGPVLSLPVSPRRFRDGVVYAFLVGGNKVSGLFSDHLFRKCDGLKGLLLNVSNNGLSGQIPQGISVMCRSLMMLDASGNRISGLVPKSLGDMRSLVFLDLSRNNLDAEVPRLGLSSDAMNQRRDRVLTSLAVKSKDQEESGMNPQNESDYQLNKGLNSIEVASVASASAIVVVLIALIVLFFYTRKWMPDSRVQGLEPREIIVFSNEGTRMTFESIVRSTGNFNASNCIGNGGFGSTFKSEIQPGVIVAVKRLSLGRFQQGIQQFHAEVKTLGRVKHPNLVTLLGYHASETEMFLIYNYLPGGNLEKFIKERSTRATDWKILHKIALDIAHALAYLHDYCVPRVLHRDVKPSNILLDNDLNAYLSDFGLSRLLGTSETHATTGVAGTFGYLAPEYAMTCRVSDKSDVYSYGVVLLELISDKRPLDPSFSSFGDGFNIVSWASMMLKQGRAKEVFTVGLWEAGPHDDLVEMLHLAITCTNETLSTRPTMKKVVQRLNRIKPLSLGS